MRILFLEDEPTIREVLTEYMKMQNYEVECAGDGEAALPGDDDAAVFTQGLYNDLNPQLEELLDEGFHGHLVDEGYIEEETNCENGTYDCDTCSLDGKCDRQEAMKSEDFDDFCGKFPTCKGCPLQNIPGDCEEDLWPKFKEEHGYG